MSSKPWLASAITRRGASEKHSGPGSAAWTSKSLERAASSSLPNRSRMKRLTDSSVGFRLRRAFAASMCRHHCLTRGRRRWLASPISVLWENIWS